MVEAPCKGSEKFAAKIAQTTFFSESIRLPGPNEFQSVPAGDFPSKWWPGFLGLPEPVVGRRVFPHAPGIGAIPCPVDCQCEKRDAPPIGPCCEFAANLLFANLGSRALIQASEIAAGDSRSFKAAAMETNPEPALSFGPFILGNPYGSVRLRVWKSAGYRSSAQYIQLQSRVKVVGVARRHSLAVFSTTNRPPLPQKLPHILRTDTSARVRA